jgi:hypothetical protein
MSCRVHCQSNGNCDYLKFSYFLVEKISRQAVFGYLSKKSNKNNNDNATRKKKIHFGGSVNVQYKHFGHVRLHFVL